MNIKQLIKKYTIKIYKKLTHIIPTSKKIIIFQSSNGRNYTGNPRYIYEEMIRQGLDKKYKCIWFLFDTSIEVPGNCKKIRNNYFPYFWIRKFQMYRNIMLIHLLWEMTGKVNLIS